MTNLIPESPLVIPKDGSLICNLCNTVLGTAVSPVSVLINHYKTTHPELDKWPKDKNGLPILRGAEYSRVIAEQQELLDAIPPSDSTVTVEEPTLREEDPASVPTLDPNLKIPGKSTSVPTIKRP